MNSSQRNLVILSVIALFIVIAAVVYSLVFSPSATVNYSETDVSTSSQIVDQTDTADDMASSTMPISVASSTDTGLFSTSTGQIDLAQFTVVDTTSWKDYSNAELGLSIKFPSDLIFSLNDGLISLVFPKAKYFHWPLQDTAKITITASFSCPNLDTWGGGVKGLQPPMKFNLNLNGYTFSLNIGTDVGVGQLYQGMTYDTTVNGVCYRIDFLDHGANGAGFYVDDKSLIKIYDEQHAKDLKAVISVLNGIVNSLKI